MNSKEVRHLVSQLPEPAAHAEVINAFLAMVGEALVGAGTEYLDMIDAIKARWEPLVTFAEATLSAVEGSTSVLPAGFLLVLDQTHISLQVGRKKESPAPLSDDSPGLHPMPSWVLTLNLTRMVIEAAGPETCSGILERLGSGELTLAVGS